MSEMRDSEPHKEGYDLTLPSHYQINENLDPYFFFFHNNFRGLKI